MKKRNWNQLRSPEPGELFTYVDALDWKTKKRPTKLALCIAADVGVVILLVDKQTRMLSHDPISRGLWDPKERFDHEPVKIVGKL